MSVALDADFGKVNHCAVSAVFVDQTRKFTAEFQLAAPLVRAVIVSRFCRNVISVVYDDGGIV